MKITARIVVKAWENWLEFHYGLHCEELETRFFTYIDPKDASEDIINWDKDNAVNVIPACAEKLKLLAGPHWRALITAAYARGSISRKVRQ